MTKTEIEKLAGIDIGDDYKVLTVSPKELLTPVNYVDILAKYMYGRARREDKLTPYVANLYIKHLMVHNKLFDGREKTSAGAFIKSFNSLLDSVEKEGFEADRSVIPVTYDMTLLDGAHRVAATLVYGSDVTVVKTRATHGWAPGWTPDDFRKRGLESEFLDQIVLQWCKMNPEARLAIVFPLVKEKYAAAKEVLARHTIYYEKEISYNRQGIGNLIAQMYKPEEWLNAATRDRHAVRRFVAGEPVRILLIKPTNQEDLIAAKTRIREMFDHGNLPVHTSDDHEETLRVAEQVFNNNSLHFFNNAHPAKFSNFLRLFDQYKDWIEEKRYDKDEFCVDGGAVLAVHGLRDCSRDLDYISFRDARCALEDINSHNDFLYLHDKPLKELIFDPRNYFYYDGYKFVAPARLKEMKQRRKDSQDAGDIALIDSLAKESSAAKNTKVLFSTGNIWNYAVLRGGHFFWLVYLRLPKWARPCGIRTYHLIKKAYQGIRKLIWKY